MHKAFREYGFELKSVLKSIGSWELQSVSRGLNKVVFMIARSVTMEQKMQSYVSQGEPVWLRNAVAVDRSLIYGWHYDFGCGVKRLKIL